jgi:hypothetical protein
VALPADRNAHTVQAALASKIVEVSEQLRWSLC